MLKIPDVHMYDTYVPIVSGIQKKHTWEQAVKLVTDSLSPLGEHYCKTLHEGLTTARWSDRYPNQGKRSGAFSSGGFDGPPYILMNYQPEVLDHVFTLAHEAGHSMHTWLSARHQPFQYYGYTIFVAEVASTFNEQLLLKSMLDRADSKKEKAYILNHAIDEIRGTIIRQTMFAEFEKIIHALVEKGEPLTVDLLRQQYRKLLERYFGVPENSGERPGPVSHFVIDPELELEGLRIPHFYGAFYVYKYATGLSRRHRPLAARFKRRQGRNRRLPQLPQRRRQQLAPRPPPRRRRRYGKTRTRRNRPPSGFKALVDELERLV